MACLYYVYNPLCSWCWAFNSSWLKIESSLPSSISSRWVMTSEPFRPTAPKNADEKERLNQYWQKVNATMRACFRHDFLHVCPPEDPAMLAARAVICANFLGKELLMRGMINEIQNAFYCQKLNPTNPTVLVNIVEKLGIGLNDFSDLMTSETVMHSLKKEFRLADDLAPDANFPSLVFERGFSKTQLPFVINSPEITTRRLQKLLVS